jgi:periplasmic mercuric ion binding protein
MKMISFFSTFLIVLISSFSFAKAKKETSKETIKVWGNSKMCKKTIEKAAKSAGALSADWNTETKLTVFSNASNVNGSDNIQQVIAVAGYDTEKFAADHMAYDNLQICCQYDRIEKTARGSKKMDCCEGGARKDGVACSKDVKKKMGINPVVMIKAAANPNSCMLRNS